MRNFGAQAPIIMRNSECVIKGAKPIVNKVIETRQLIIPVRIADREGDRSLII